MAQRPEEVLSEMMDKADEMINEDPKRTALAFGVLLFTGGRGKWLLKLIRKRLNEVDNDDRMDPGSHLFHNKVIVPKE